VRFNITLICRSIGQLKNSIIWLINIHCTLLGWNIGVDHCTPTDTETIGSWIIASEKQCMLNLHVHVTALHLRTSQIWYDILKLSEISDSSRLTCMYIIKGNLKTLNLETIIRNRKPECGIQILWMMIEIIHFSNV